MASISKLQEYIEIIENEQDGEAMRDAIERAIIVADDINATIALPTKLSSFMEYFDEALDIMWDDISSFFPNAVRPTAREFEQPSVMNDELEDILKSLISSVLGPNIRSAIVSSFRNILNTITSHSFSMLFYTPTIIDIFDAFIAACDDEDKKTAALATRDQWYAFDYQKEIQNIYDSISSNILSLSEAPTGEVARPLIISILNSLIENRREEIARLDYGVWYGYEYIQHGYWIETIANILVEPTEFADYRYNISAGGPYATMEEAESRYAEVVAIDTESTYDVVDLFDGARRGFYVILSWSNTNDGWYLTYAGANKRAYEGNDSHVMPNTATFHPDGSVTYSPQLNLVVIDSPYKDL